jgi:hypothetical protein
MTKVLSYLSSSYANESNIPLFLLLFVFFLEIGYGFDLLAFFSMCSVLTNGLHGILRFSWNHHILVIPLFLSDSVFNVISVGIIQAIYLV